MYFFSLPPESSVWPPPPQHPGGPPLRRRQPGAAVQARLRGHLQPPRQRPHPVEAGLLQGEGAPLRPAPPGPAGGPQHGLLRLLLPQHPRRRRRRRRRRQGGRAQQQQRRRRRADGRLLRPLLRQGHGGQRRRRMRRLAPAASLQGLLGLPQGRDVRVAHPRRHQRVAHCEQNHGEIYPPHKVPSFSPFFCVCV